MSDTNDKNKLESNKNTLHKIKCLVFSGGGIKGLCHIGCLKALEERDVYKQISCIIGTSCGSIIALLYNLHYNYHVLEEILLEIDFNHIQDINTDTILDYFNNFGIDSGKKIEKIIRIFIKKKVNNDNITFLELYNLTNKKLIITGSCLNNASCTEFSYLTHPDLPIIRAIKISIAIPFIFNAQNLDNNLYVDGALTQNLALDLYPEKKEILGFLIKTNISYKNIDTIEKYTQCVLQCIDNKFTDIYYKLYPDIIITLSSKINGLDFTIDKQQRKLLFLEGYDSTNIYLDKYIYRLNDN